MRLICADAFEMDVQKCVMFGNTAFIDKYEVLFRLHNAPTIDAVPVVRCKDCKHSHPWYADRRTCELWTETGVDVFNDGFCSYGERKDNADE